MRALCEGLSFLEIEVDEFLEGIEEYVCHEEKVLARKPAAASVLLVAVDTEGEMQGFLLLENFDRVTVYAQYGYLNSDDLAFLKVEANNIARYFCVGQEPHGIYVRRYNWERIFAAAEDIATKQYCNLDIKTLDIKSMETCLDRLEARSGFTLPDVIGIFLTR